MNYSTNNNNSQTYVTGFRIVRNESTNIISFDGSTVRIRIVQSSNSGLPKLYTYTTIDAGYRPTYSVSAPLATIGDNGEVYGYIRAQNDGSLNLILSKQTYNASTGGMTLYGTLEYTL